MIHLGLKASELVKLRALLVTAHRVDVMVELLDLSHNYLGDLSDILMGGQVNIDTTADVTRSAGVELLDPQHKLHLDAQGPQDGSMYLTRMIKITYIVSTPDLTSRYFIPIFCGPMTKVSRSGPIVSVEAQGKETLSFSEIWKGKTYKKGAKKTQVIKAIMAMAGEAYNKMNITDHQQVLGAALNANHKKKFWTLARKISHSMNMHLYYDGRGVLQFRRLPSKVVYIFDDTRSILTDPQVAYDATDIYNCVDVTGGKPKHAKKKVHYRLVAPKKHPLSPSNLGRNDTPRYLPLFIEDSSLKSFKQARALAKRQLKNSLHEAVEVTFDSLPIPFLEEMDLCKYSTESASGKFRMTKMAIPLTADGVSSVGYLRKVTPKRINNRSHHKRSRNGLR